MNTGSFRGTGLRSRRATYAAMVGMAATVLVVGLALPFVFGDRVAEQALSAGGQVPLGEDETFTGEDPGVLDPTDAGGAVEGVTPHGAGGPAGGTTGPGPEGSAPPGEPGSAPVAGPAPGSGLRATDVGVTPTTIRIGVLILDVGSIGRLGIGVPGVDPEQQRQAYEAQLAVVNRNGGIHGRKVEAVYENFDVLSQDDMRRACLALRDKKVFAIIAGGGYAGAAILCVTEEGRTPLVNNGGHGTPTEFVRRSRGLLFSLFPVSERVMANWAGELDRMGALKGKKVGILSQDSSNPGDSVIGGELVPVLERLGHTPAHVSRLSADINTAASQVPVEVQQMRSKGVDMVFLSAATLASTQFVQAADNQGYHPAYSITDWVSMNTDASNQNMPESFDGAIGITTYRTGEEKVGVKENAAERECRALYEEGTGRKLDAKGSNEHGLTMGNCTMLQALVKGLAETGPELTRDRFSQGMQRTGAFPMTMWGGGGFAPGKFGAADLVRTIRWFGDCRCLKPTSDFRQPRF